MKGDIKYLKRAKSMIALAFKEFSVFKRTGSESYAMQAGEKAWNALVQLGMFYASEESLKHKVSISQIKDIPYGDNKELLHLVSIGDSLHANFYHNFKRSDILLDDLESIRRFVNKKLKEEGFRLK